VKAFFENYLDFFITFCAAIVVGSQYYLESIVGLEPCNLCILQKYSAQAVFFIFLFKMLVLKFKFLFDFLGIFALAFGVSASGRQIYLQNIPKDELAGGYCDTPFYLLFDMNPFFDAMAKVFQGSSKCAEEVWSLLGLNIAEWSMVFFASMIGLMLVRYLLIILKGHKYN
tara:strand:+ start:20869 stop:21378 length:510 start_codon:yes stop_codon:yes gene_type:complete